MLTEQHLGRLSRIFKMLGDENRLALLQLMATERKPLDQTTMVQKLTDQQRVIAQQTLSWHLRSLVTAELVMVQKIGRHHYYLINPLTINETFLFIHNLNPELGESSDAGTETNH